MTSDPETPTSESAREPSVLDYLKSRLSFGRRPAIVIPAEVGQNLELGAQVREGTGPRSAQAVVGAAASIPLPASPPARPLGVIETIAASPWRSLSALCLALLAQRFFEPPHPSGTAGTTIYIVALAVLVWAALRGEWTLAPVLETSSDVDPLTFRRAAFLASIPLAVLAFLLLTGNLFNLFNVAVWLIAIGLFVSSLWLSRSEGPSLWQRLSAFISRGAWNIRIDGWTLLVLVVSVLVLFFRVYHLQQTPAEPFSDHAEKLLDVYDVSQGQTHIFFPRNTGREAIIMYWSLVTSWAFGTGFSFMTLKLATVTLGLLTMPYVYLLGKEVANRRVGLLAVLR